MTKDILNLMEDRSVKNDPDKYKQLNRVISDKIREAKEKEMCEKCLEIETFQKNTIILMSTIKLEK